MAACPRVSVGSLATPASSVSGRLGGARITPICMNTWTDIPHKFQQARTLFVVCLIFHLQRSALASLLTGECRLGRRPQKCVSTKHASHSEIVCVCIHCTICSVTGHTTYLRWSAWVAHTRYWHVDLHCWGPAALRVTRAQFSVPRTRTPPAFRSFCSSALS